MKGKGLELKAVDLYAGIGGWSLGLGLAGVKVVSSYEWWKDANLTNRMNNRHATEEADVRTMDLSSIPQAEVLVGSPPCTQFSLANRGGRGNIMEGLKDVERFLEAVEIVRPKFWAFENVPRLAEIFQREINQGGSLHRFAHLNPTVAVLDASEWGVPQRRKRAIIGNFDLDLLLEYRSVAPSRTLGDVVSLLSLDDPIDPVWGIPAPPEGITDHVLEGPLSPEEERLNRDSKCNHPVYNGMRFPEDLSKPSRTVTATCTRVSRESIVVGTPGEYRRLTLRERASVQSFPITYRFYAPTHSLKQKMVGNALPPLLSYYIAHSFLGTSKALVPRPEEAISGFVPPKDPQPSTAPDKPGRSYPKDRKFRCVIPGLGFKSGTRFELYNRFESGKPIWRVKFFFGNSKDKSEIEPGTWVISKADSSDLVRPCIARALNSIVEAGGIVNNCNPEELQKVWCHSESSGPHPFKLADAIGFASARMSEKDHGDAPEAFVSSLMSLMGNPTGHKKVLRNATRVFSGLLVCSLFNEFMDSMGEAAKP